MKIIVKKLQGGECIVDVQSTTFISDVKRQVAAQLEIPVDEQKLLYLGRTLVDEQTVQSYHTIKDGSKLNLLIKKPESPEDIAYQAFKKAGMTDSNAKTTARKFLTVLEENLNKLSWDDLDRLALDCLEEGPRKNPQTKPEENA